MDVTVILQSDVAGLGEEGDVKKVAGGYARNFLLPRRLAIPATKGNMKVLEQQRSRIEHQLEQRRAEARALGDRLAGLALEFDVRVGEQGRLYGSITSQEIAARLKSQADIEIDRRSIDLKEPLRALGEFDVPVRVAHSVTVHLKVTLRDQNAPRVQPAAPAPQPAAVVEQDAMGAEPEAADETATELATPAE